MLVDLLGTYLVLDGVPLPHHRVFGPGIRMAIVGSPEAAKTTCEYIAGDMVRHGLRSAACVYPSRKG